MQAVARFHHLLRMWASKLGPYLVLEIVLPGGTLFALLLFLYRRSRLSQAASRAPHAAGGSQLPRESLAMSNC